MLLLSLLLACESEPTVDETTTSTVNVEESKIEATTSEVTNTTKGETATTSETQV